MAQSKGIWIDDDILGDEELNPSEKIVLALLSNLCKKDGTCTASNDYLLERCHYTRRTLVRMIETLEYHGYIERVNRKSTQRVIRILRQNGVVTTPNMVDSLRQNGVVTTPNMVDSLRQNGVVTTPTCEVSSYYKKKNNNINIIKKGVPPTKEEIIEYCRSNGYTFSVDYFVDYYSQVGWKRKGSAIDWRAAADYWQKHQKKEQPKASENRRNDFDLAFFDEVEAAMRKDHQDES